MTVPEVFEAHGALVLHGTRFNGGADINLFIPRDAPVSQRITQAVRSSTVISCATFSTGDACANLFAPVGLVLSAGNVVAAHPHDLGSTIDSSGNRNGEPQVGAVSLQLENAIHNRQGGYNELLVGDHHQCGIYVCWDEPGYVRQQLQDIPAFVAATAPLKLPLFVLQGSAIYRAEWTPTGDVMLGEFLQVQDIAQQYF